MIGDVFRCAWCDTEAMRVRKRQRYCSRRCGRLASKVFVRGRDAFRARQQARDIEGAERLGLI